MATCRDADRLHFGDTSDRACENTYFEFTHQSMLLEDLIRNPSGCMEYMQRYINNLSPSGYHITPSGCYNPRSASVPFNIPYFKIKLTDSALLHLRSTSVTPLDDFVYSRGALHFFVHPLLLDMYRDAFLAHTIDKRIHWLPVVLTASARTVRPASPELSQFLIKLQYDGVLGRIRRAISRENIRHVANISTDLLEHSRKESAKLRRVSYFDEPIVAHCALDSTKSIGICFRFGVPMQSPGRDRILIPGHALYSEDLHHPTDPSLLTQWLRAFSSVDRLDLFCENLIRPIVEAYFVFACSWGFAPEAHAQNTYIEFQSNLEPSRVIFQGLGGFLYDVEVRQHRSYFVRTSEYRKYLEPNDESRYAERSWYFDQKLCEYFLYQMIQVFCRDFGVDAEVVILRVRAMCDDEIQCLPFSYFPPIAYRQADTGPDSPKKLVPCKLLFRSS